ncbi:MAG: hypothetical protein ACYSWS_05945 [Planctomycetota bacterium]|jgi:hypothetical protein
MKFNSDITDCRTHYPFCTINYWERHEIGGSTAARADDDWDKAVVSVSPYVDMDFNSDEKYKMQNLIRMLEVAFENGRKSKEKELKTVLGIHI